MEKTLAIKFEYTNEKDAEDANYKLCEQLSGSNGFVEDTIFVTSVDYDATSDTFGFFAYFDGVPVTKAKNVETC